MFSKGHGEGHRRKSGGGIIGVFRLIISLIIMAILGFGVLLAYKSFSGIDPLQVDPGSVARNFLTSESALTFVKGLLTVDPKTSLQNAKNMLSESEAGSSANTIPSAPVKFRFAVIADSHKDLANLQKALAQAKSENAEIIIGMGDFSDVGTLEDLNNTKLQFDGVGIPYYVTAGDHDLWDARNQKKSAEENFKEVFGSPYQAFTHENTRFILFYNSDNYQGLDTTQLQWLEDELKTSGTSDAKLIFATGSTPLYHPSSDHVMGKVTPKLKNQATHLLSIFKRNGVDEVFAADTHFFSRFTEPANDLKITTVGAVTRDRNPQTPRFAMVDVFEDGTYNVREVEVK